MINIISDSEKNAALADALVARAYEINSYDINIANYQAIVDTLSGLSWTDDLLPLRGLPPHEAAAQVEVNQIELLSNLQQLDRANALLRSEMLERNKAQSVMDAIESQLPADQIDQLVSEAIARRNSATA